MTVHSYSALKCFNTCPRQYEALYLLKSVKRTSSPALEKGIAWHEALEKAVRDNAPLPSHLSKWQPLADTLRRAGAKVEVKLAMDREGNPCGFWDKHAWLRGAIDVDTGQLLLDWKGLPVDTPLPTPSGWVTMGEVREGDTLFDIEGKPCTVQGKSQVKKGPGYRITFDDATTIECDSTHLWQTRRGVVPIQALVPGDHIDMPGPLDLPDRELPLHPYVLGCWLGDGKHTDGSICKPDAALFNNIEACGYEVAPPQRAPVGKTPTRTVRGIRGVLDRLGVLGNKHVPPAYLRASVNQRLALLQGLLDTDGDWNRPRKRANFTTCDMKLAEAVQELALSLGERATIHPHKATGFGKTVDAYYVNWAVRNFNPFRLPRKRDQVVFQKGRQRSSRRAVRSITPVPEMTSQCVSVDSPTNTYLAGRQMVPTHNTGKVYPDPLQADVYTALKRAALPKLKVDFHFVYLEHNKVVTMKPNQDATNRVVQYIARVEQAETYPPRPCFACRWCPVTQCEYNGG